MYHASAFQLYISLTGHGRFEVITLIPLFTDSSRLFVFRPRGQSVVLVERSCLGPRRQKLGRNVSQSLVKSSPKQLPLVVWEKMLSVKEKSALVVVIRCRLSSNFSGVNGPMATCRSSQ